MSEVSFFQDLAVIMTAAGVVSAVFARFGWPKVLGYILAGVVMSEHTWGGSFLVDITSIRTIGQLGILFLMFGMGLSFSPRDMAKIRSVALPSAIIDTVVMIWLGYTLGTRLFGWSAVPSLFLGVAICDSATTLLAKVIDEMSWGSRPFAKYVLGTSVCEDIICVGAIAVATGFANGSGMSVGAMATSLGWLAVFILSVLIVGLVFVPRLLRSVSRFNDNESLILTVLGICFLVSYFAFKFDFSLALGAFVVGLVSSMSPVRERIDTLVEPLKSMFSAMFFVSIGLLVDPLALCSNLPAILIVSAVVIFGKTVNNTFASIATGLDVKTAVQNGMGLAQIGEFAFMVAILYAGLVDDSETPMFQIAVGASLLTTLLNPMMIRLSDRVGDFAVRRIPARVDAWLATYRGWLSKIGASENSPAFMLLKVAAIRLGIYAVLMLSASVACALLYTFDFSPYSEMFNRYRKIIFFALANLFSVALMPMIVFSARALAEEVAVLLTGDGNAKWQLSLRPIIRFGALVATVAMFFIEWTMISTAIAPRDFGAPWIMAGILLAVAIVGWKFFARMGRRASQRLQEALTADERREGFSKTMTVTVPEGAIYRCVLPSTSPAIGETVVTLNIRAKTGASVVSVIRNGNTTRNIGPEWEFAIGDTIVALGEQSQIAALKDLLGIVS